jgi:hypothetical protein
VGFFLASKTPGRPRRKEKMRKPEPIGHGVESVFGLMEMVPYGPLVEVLLLMGLMVVLLAELRGVNTARISKTLKALSLTRRKALTCFHMSYRLRLLLGN